MPLPADFSGKTLRRIGGAGGLGQTTTLSFLWAGATVVAVDNDPGKIDELKAGGRAQAI
jgi:NAD(P)-dependent dehydrogenase (short-subunit alcohol dehydrogenase family)